MNISDEELQAYVDGELAPPEAARVEAAMADDVMVAARVERERRLRAHVRGAYESVLVEAVPERLTERLRSAQAGERATTTPPLRQQSRRTTRWRIPAYAMAASVAVLVAAAWLRPSEPAIGVEDGVLVAGGGLAETLDVRLASEPSEGSTVGLTFRDGRGRICRSFSDARVAGLACRADDRWHIEVASATPAVQNGSDLRQAAADLPPELQAAVDARVAGDVFDARQEREARDAGWR